MRRLIITFLAAAGFSTMAVGGVIVQVTATGTVAANQIASGPLAGATIGDAVNMSFEVDSDVFTNSGFFPTRGYNIIPASFSFTAGVGTVGLGASPSPSYFVLRNNDPAVDGFFVSTDVDLDLGIPADSDSLTLNFIATYGAALLSSLDILGAFGSYGPAGSSQFHFEVTDGMAIAFEELTIGGAAAVPEPTSTLLLGVGLAALGFARRRTRD